MCRDEAQPHVQGFPGAKFKKFKTQPEAEQWYKSNLPQRSVNPQTTAATHTTPTITSPNTTSITPRSTATATTSRSTATTYASSNPPQMPISRPPPQSVSRTVTTPAPRPAQTPRIAPPRNTTIDVVYSDGACQGNGGPNAVAGIGVWWGPGDPRYDGSSTLQCLAKLIWITSKEPIGEMPRWAD